MLADIPPVSKAKVSAHLGVVRQGEKQHIRFPHPAETIRMVGNCDIREVVRRCTLDIHGEIRQNTSDTRQYCNKR